MIVGHAASDQRTARIILASLIFVALLGTIMRYKIGFSLPVFHQKFLQEAHSHFAFAGWLSQILLFLLVRMLRRELPVIPEKFYRRILVAHLLIAYGMLISFWIQGYGTISIILATASVLVFVIFALRALRDLWRLDPRHPARAWWIGALVLGLISYGGTFMLTRMMVIGDVDQRLYLGSIYYYLHFQYNGWFLFACLGLVMDSLRPGIQTPDRQKLIFWLFFGSSLPAFFLSTLWATLPGWLYILVIVSAAAQAGGWLLLASDLWKSRKHAWPGLTGLPAWLILIAAAALSIKLVLQLGSTIPEVSQLAFSFRNIVIAYLHLVLLLMLTVFLLGYLISIRLITLTPPGRIGIIVFVAGAILNELVLTLQGVASFSYTLIPGANHLLVAASVAMLVGISTAVIGCRRHDAHQGQG